METKTKIIIGVIALADIVAMLYLISAPSKKPTNVNLNNQQLQTQQQLKPAVKKQEKKVIPKKPPVPKQNVPTNEPQQTVCTQEVILCSNGTYVGRTGPNCEFAPCPVN